MGSPAAAPSAPRTRRATASEPGRPGAGHAASSSVVRRSDPQIRGGHDPHDDVVPVLELRLRTFHGDLHWSNAAARQTAGLGLDHWHLPVGDRDSEIKQWTRLTRL